MSYYTFLRNIYFITITNFVFGTLFLQSSSEISVIFIADVANSNIVPMAALEDGDAFSSNSSQEGDDGEEEVASNLRIQRVGLGGRSYKRRHF
jgi:hypothetical protein